MTKVMTALLALEHGTLTDSITVTEADLADMDPSGSNSGLIAGETFTLEELLYCLLIESANDAAPVIANYIAGSESAFVEMMNQKAAELGCTGTHFSNTHGLHDTEHYSTARDIAKIMRAALEFDVFRTISSTDLYEMPATEGHEARTLITTNYLIGTYYTGLYLDRRVICGKTGFTTPAGRCVVTLAETDDLQYITVVMGASDGEEDGSYLYGSFLSTSRLLNFGSSGFTTVEALSPNLTVDQIPVADTNECVAVAPSGTVRTLLPSDYDPAQLHTLYDLSDTLRVPVKAGQVVGTVYRYYGNICVAQSELITLSGLDPVPTTIHSPIPDSSLPVSTAPSGPSVWMIAVGVLLGSRRAAVAGADHFDSAGAGHPPSPPPEKETYVMTDWNQLEQRCQSCTRCELCKTRHNVVFGVGPRNADILFVGEGPGQQEDLQGEPVCRPGPAAAG